MAPILAIRAISHAPFLRSRVAWPRAISQIASWKHAVRSRVRLCVSNMPPRGRPTHELHSRRLAIATPCHRHRLTLPLAPRPSPCDLAAVLSPAPSPAHVRFP